MRAWGEGLGLRLGVRDGGGVVKGWLATASPSERSESYCATMRRAYLARVGVSGVGVKVKRGEGRGEEGRRVGERGVKGREDGQVRLRVQLGPGEPRADGAADDKADARGGDLARDADRQCRPEIEQEAWVRV